MAQDEKVVLLHGDVNAIKDFVFEVSSLPQIRGASQLLVECEDRVGEELVEKFDGEKIYCSGGSFLFKVPADKAEAAKTAIKELYLRHTLAATVTVVYERAPLPQDLPNVPSNGWAKRLWDMHRQAHQSGHFARRVAFLSTWLREAKAWEPEAPFFEALPFSMRCEACGKRVALKEVPRYEPTEREQVELVALCQVCLRRHQVGVKSKERQVRGWFNECFQKAISPAAKQPPDLDHLVQSARRKYVAFLYIDGNDIGKLLQQVQNEEEFKALSKALEESSQQALFEALQVVCSRELQNDKGYWPFEIINIGGDDVTLLIQAGYAWEVAIEFLKRFEEHVRVRVEEQLGYWPRAWPEKITASCGIAIADVKYPIRYLERLASDLLKEAKREAKADPIHPQSAVTFLWLPNPIAAEKAEPLMAYYRHGEWQLTARPCTLERAKVLIALAQEASQWPGTLRHRWGEALETNGWVALNTVYYDIARRKEEDKRKQLAEFIVEVGKLARQREFKTDAPAPLWQPYKHNGRLHWRTALLDVLELAELRAMRPDVREEAE